MYIFFDLYLPRAFLGSVRAKQYLVSTCEAGPYHSHGTLWRIDAVEIARGATQQLSFLEKASGFFVGTDLF